MYTSKFKLLFHWLGIVTGFYVFWALSYLILAKFATSQFNRFQYTKQSLWTELTASDVFWYIMFIFGMILTIYVIHMLIRYAPHRKAAALVFAGLIIISVGVLLDKLLETSSGFSSLPHIFINGVFLISIVYAFFKAEQPSVRNEEDYLDEGEE